VIGWTDRKPQEGVCERGGHCGQERLGPPTNGAREDTGADRTMRYVQFSSGGPAVVAPIRIEAVDPLALRPRLSPGLPLSEARPSQGANRRGSPQGSIGRKGEVL
jgi:hypothetical protein